MMAALAHGASLMPLTHGSAPLHLGLERPHYLLLHSDTKALHIGNGYIEHSYL